MGGLIKTFQNNKTLRFINITVLLILWFQHELNIEGKE
jgi:hypothetical protein